MVRCVWTRKRECTWLLVDYADGFGAYDLRQKVRITTAVVMVAGIEQRVAGATSSYLKLERYGSHSYLSQFLSPTLAQPTCG
jgi:hypothetical protein